jgi:hypothetical protein
MHSTDSFDCHSGREVYMRWGFFVVVAAAVALAPACVRAAGAPIRGQPIRATTSIVPPVAPSIAVTREQALGGCGGKRVRDPVTKQCRGPGDLPH